MSSPRGPNSAAADVAGFAVAAAERQDVRQLDEAMSLKFFRAFWNAPFIGGLAILVVGTGPLVVSAVLQELRMLSLYLICLIPCSVALRFARK